MHLKKTNGDYVIKTSVEELNDLYGAVKSKLQTMDGIILEVPRCQHMDFMRMRKRLMFLRDEILVSINPADLKIL